MTKAERPEPLVVSVVDAMHMLNISRTEIYRLFGDGRLSAVKHGVRTLVRVTSLHAYLDTLPPAGNVNAKEAAK